jgi:hypothetical protein
MTTANNPLDPVSDLTAQLKPSFRLPIALVLISVPFLFLQVWVGIAIVTFGLFLMYQAATLRLLFTTTDLDIYRSETLIRRFPYQEWQDWKIFWSGVPILFYFKEVKSIHFLPILFDPKALQSSLEARVSIGMSPRSL